MNRHGHLKTHAETAVGRSLGVFDLRGCRAADPRACPNGNPTTLDLGRGNSDTTASAGVVATVPVAGRRRRAGSGMPRRPASSRHSPIASLSAPSERRRGEGRHLRGPPRSQARGVAMTDTPDLVAFGDDLDDDSPAAVCVRTALSHRPTRAEALFLDPDEGGIPDRRHARLARRARRPHRRPRLARRRPRGSRPLRW